MSLLKILLAAAVASKVSSPKKTSGRRDLFGTNLCHYGEKDKNGWTMHCSKCPQYWNCTQRGRFKEGS